jgi:hypothetical protein
MKHLIRFIGCIFGLIGGYRSMAQLPMSSQYRDVDSVRVEGTSREPRLVLKFSPLAILQPESLYRLDAEYLLGGRHSIQGGLGYGTGYYQLFGGNTQNDRETWRAQTEWRIYVNRDRQATRWRPIQRLISKPLGQYFAVETFYKQVNAHYSGTLQRGCQDGNCQFYESYTALARRYVAGFHLKFGKQVAIRLSETNNRLLIDYYVGLGGRWRWFEQRGVPTYEDARPANNFSNTIDPTSGWGVRAGGFASIAMGVQIGYAF